MRFRLGQFSLWFTVFYLALQFGADARHSTFDPGFRWWFQGNPIILVSGFFAFWLQALIAYTVLYFTVEKRGLLLSGMALLAVFPLLILIRFFIQEVFIDLLFGITNYRDDVKLTYYFADNVYYTSLFCSFSVFWFIHRFGRHKDQLASELDIRHKKMELDFLKSQVNPHFLFNNLNSIYALVHARSEKALPALEHLSDLLRYGLYEKNTLVPIAREWQMMLHYIELQRLRHDYPLALQMVHDIFPEPVLLPPLTLVPLVENAFKHGTYKSPEKGIVISLRKKENTAVIEVSNAVAPREKEPVGGVGLENIRRRLALLLPEKHRLEILETTDRFIVRITLFLQT